MVVLKYYFRALCTQKDYCSAGNYLFLSIKEFEQKLLLSVRISQLFEHKHLFKNVIIFWRSNISVIYRIQEVGTP